MTHDWPFDTTHVWALVVGIIAVARLSRLVVFDDFPPMKWARLRWHVAMNENGWEKLVDCAFCAAPYLAAADMGWAYLSDLHWTWWVFNLWLAASYVAAMIVARDEPDD